MGTRRERKARLSRVVAGGSQGILLPSAQYLVSSVWKIHSCHDFFGSVTVLLFPYGSDTILFTCAIV